MVPKISKAFTKTNRVENTEDTDKNSKDYIGKWTRKFKATEQNVKVYSLNYLKIQNVL